MQKDDAGSKLNWFQVRWLEYQGGETEFNYKTDLGLTTPFRRCKLTSQCPVILLPAYTADLPVSSAKLRDLLSMCQDRTVPIEHHGFYQNLRAAATERDRIAEPSASDDEADA